MPDENESGEVEYGEGGELGNSGVAQEWGESNESESTELGATVTPTTRYQYRFVCDTCGVTGQAYDSEGQAQNEGLTHEREWHPRVYRIEAVGAY